MSTAACQPQDVSWVSSWLHDNLTSLSVQSVSVIRRATHRILSFKVVQSAKSSETTAIFGMSTVISQEQTQPGTEAYIISPQYLTLLFIYISCANTVQHKVWCLAERSVCLLKMRNITEISLKHNITVFLLFFLLFSPIFPPFSLFENCPLWIWTSAAYML